VTCLDVQLSCCHTSLFVTYALCGVTSQQQNRLTHCTCNRNGRSHTMLRDHTVALQMPSAKTSTIVDRSLKDKRQLVGIPST